MSRRGHASGYACSHLAMTLEDPAIGSIGLVSLLACPAQHRPAADACQARLRPSVRPLERGSNKGNHIGGSRCLFMSFKAHFTSKAIRLMVIPLGSRPITKIIGSCSTVPQQS